MFAISVDRCGLIPFSLSFNHPSYAWDSELARRQNEMGMPASPNARLFYRCALDRFEEARILHKAGQLTTGAVYLAGYGVECILKALILNALTESKQKKMLDSFRGSKAHDFEWLRTQYFLGGGARFPSDAAKDFTLVSDWSTDLRYLPKKTQKLGSGSISCRGGKNPALEQREALNMAINIPRGKKDKVIDQIISALKDYEKAHPKAKIDVYRQNSVSVRIRIIDPAFRGIDKSERHEMAWKFLEQIPEEPQSDISMLVLVTPDEMKKSFGNIEFEDPIPSAM